MAKASENNGEIISAYQSNNNGRNNRNEEISAKRNKYAIYNTSKAKKINKYAHIYINHGENNLAKESNIWKWKW